MGWVSVRERLPKTNGKYYRCVCFTNVGIKTIKCWFHKGKNGPKEWCPDHFVYRKRVPYVIFWWDKGKASKN